MHRLLSLAEAVVGLPEADDALRSALRLQRADALAGALAALPLRALKPLRDAATPGSCRLPGLPIAPRDAARLLLAGVALHGQDAHVLSGRPTPAGVVVPWLLGCATEDSDRAQLATNELLGRLGGLHLASSHVGRGASWMHALGGAAAAGVALGLDPTELAHAFALALLDAPRDHAARLKSPARWVQIPDAVMTGVRSAEAAAAGLRAPLHLLDDGQPLLREVAGPRPLLGWLTGWGQGWLTKTLHLHEAPASAWVEPCLLGFSALQRSLEAEGIELTPASVLRVDLDVGLPTAACELRFGGYDSPPTLCDSPSQAVAAALALGRAPALSDLDPGAALWSHIGELTGRVHVRHDWALTLEMWHGLRGPLALERLLAGAGPALLLASVRGSGARDGVGAWGPPLGGTGLNWAELPLAWTEQHLESDADEPGALVAQVAGALLRRLEPWLEDPAGRLLARIDRAGRAAAKAAAGQGYDLAALPLDRLSTEPPCRVRVLLHGGQVREAAAPPSGGSPRHPVGARRALVRAKADAALAGLGRQQGADVVDHLLEGAPWRDAIDAVV